MIDTGRPHPSVLLVAAKWWSLSARLALALIRHGCQVQALCPAEHPLTHVSGSMRRIYPFGRTILARQRATRLAGVQAGFGHTL